MVKKMAKGTKNVKKISNAAKKVIFNQLQNRFLNWLEKGQNIFPKVDQIFVRLAWRSNVLRASGVVDGSAWEGFWHSGWKFSMQGGGVLLSLVIIWDGSQIEDRTNLEDRTCIS